MPLHAKADEPEGLEELDLTPVYSRIEHAIPRHRLPAQATDPDVALQLVRDELILDGNARLNLATFVTTWMEPQAAQLMAECFSKNMIDKDEYPQTAELERRCVNILADLWHAPPAAAADRDGLAGPTGCSTTGSSEGAMLGGLALLWRWRARGAAAGRAAESGDGHQRPGLLGEVLPVLAGGAPPGTHGARPPAPDRPGSRRPLR